MFTLATSCLIMSNLPWFMDLTFQVPMQHCSLQYQTLHHQTHSQLSIISALAQDTSFFLELFLCSSPVAYWTPTDLGTSFSYAFAFSYCSWGSHGKNTGVVWHSVLQWTTLCSIPWPVCLGWPCMAWLIASLSYSSSFAMTWLWPMKGLLLAPHLYLAAMSSLVYLQSIWPIYPIFSISNIWICG